MVTGSGLGSRRRSSVGDEEDLIGEGIRSGTVWMLQDPLKWRRGFEVGAVRGIDVWTSAQIGGLESHPAIDRFAGRRGRLYRLAAEHR